MVIQGLMIRETVKGHDLPIIIMVIQGLIDKGNCERSWSPNNNHGYSRFIDKGSCERAMISQ